LSADSTLRLDQDLVPLVASEINLATAVIPAHEGQPAAPSPPELPTLEEVERTHILVTLRQTNGVIDGPKGAARILNLHPNTLRHRMTKLGIKRSTLRQS
jgi:formate hydrogenlyase transcriptional activator